MDDELKDKRHQKQAAQGIHNFVHGTMAQSSVAEFTQWILDNMPTEGLAEQANSTAGGIFGMLIGAWFDAGASRENVQEYLKRFVDMSWEQYEAIKKQQ